MRVLCAAELELSFTVLNDFNPWLYVPSKSKLSLSWLVRFIVGGRLVVGLVVCAVRAQAMGRTLGASALMSFVGSCRR